MDLHFNFSNKRTLVGLIILVCLISLIVYSPRIISLSNPSVCTIDGVCQHEKRVDFLTEMIPVFVIIGVIIGALVFFFMSIRQDNQRKDFVEVIDALIQFLGRDEKLVVKKIFDNNGRVLQAELSRLEGLGKVRSHRVVTRLLDRGVIEKESFGKTNIIKLNKRIREVLLEKK